MNPQSEYSGHRARLREKYIQAGSTAFPDYELLELLLTYSLPRRDVKPLAKTLIRMFGSFGKVVDAPVADLLKCKGITMNSVTLIKLSKDFAKRYLEQEVREEEVMDGTGKIADFVRMQIGGNASEFMMVMYLNSKFMMIDYETMSEGTTDQVNVYPAEIAKKALLRNARAIVLCHNHPGGDASPSADDLTVTKQVRDMLHPFNIFLLDHVIVSRYDTVSIRDRQESMPLRVRVLDELPETGKAAENLPDRRQRRRM